jgi:hypothetical protein
VPNEARDVDTMAPEAVLDGEAAVLVPVEAEVAVLCGAVVFGVPVEETPVLAGPVPVKVGIEPVVLGSKSLSVYSDIALMYATETSDQYEESIVTVVTASLHGSERVVVTASDGHGQVVAILPVGFPVLVVVAVPSKICGT